MSYWSGGSFWAPRKTSAERRADAARMIAEAARRGRRMSPVTVTGRKIAQTFWGTAWCDNLERYRDFAYRLERGRSYLRSGSVIDLQIEAGAIAAQVSGSSLYDIAIEIDTVERKAWRAIQRDCAGSITSRIDLLGGLLSEAVMARLCADRTGLFPHPSAIRFRCSCPDHATMCKHVAAAMYGVGVRLDQAPELLFTLRRVSLDELVASAVTELPAAPSAGRMLAADGLAALFGIELAADAPAPSARPAPGARTPPTRAAPRGRASSTPRVPTPPPPVTRGKAAPTGARAAPTGARAASTGARASPTGARAAPTGARAASTGARAASRVKKRARSGRATRPRR